jgi:hypothetical protein
MSNIGSHSLPKAELFSALGSHFHKLSSSAWRRLPFGVHRKIPTNEPLKAQKPLPNQSLAIPAERRPRLAPR